MATEKAFLGVMTTRRYFIVCSFLCLILLFGYFTPSTLQSNVLQNRHHAGESCNSKDELEMFFYGNLDLIQTLFTHPSIYPSSLLARPVVSHFAWTDGMFWSDSVNKLIFTDPHINKIFTFDPWDGSAGSLDIVSNDCGDTNVIPEHTLATMGEPGCNSVIMDSNNNTFVSQFGTKRIVVYAADAGQDTNLSHVYAAGQVNNTNIDDGAHATVLDKMRHFAEVKGYDGKQLNGPAHLIIHEGFLYFSDPQYGLSRVDGSFDASEIGFQGVYKVDLQLLSSPNAVAAVELIEDKIEAPNGIVFAPDGKFMYVSNCLDGKFEVWVYRVLAGQKFELVTKWNEANGNIQGLDLLLGSLGSDEKVGCVDGFMIENWPERLIEMDGNGELFSIDKDSSMMVTTCPGGRLCVLEVKGEQVTMKSVIKFAKGSILSGVAKGGDRHLYVSGLGKVWRLIRNKHVW